MAKFSVGQRVWEFDENKRVYRKPEEGRIYSGNPIYAEHFREHVVAEVLPRSYLVRSAGHFATTKYSHEKAERKFRTDEQKDQQTWMNYHRVMIVEMVRENCDPAVLKRVAEAIGYQAD